MQSVDTVVVGGGHAGLAMSYCLTQRGVEHVVCERGDVGQRWRDERWDSLTLLTPNWATELPGFPYDGPDRDGFDGRDAYVAHLERYARSFGAPVQRGCAVTRVSAGPKQAYRIDTSHGRIEARSVVAATGPFQAPVFPEGRRDVPAGVVQVHSSAYRRPSQLPDGAVLVVGSGNSGLQIVDELTAAGRRVFASVGRIRGAPRRYRGRDLIRWLIDLGALDTRVEDASPDARRLPPPSLSGVGGGHDLNLRRMSQRGAVFLGRFLGGEDGRLHFADDRDATLRASANAYRDVRDRVDRLVRDRGWDAPLDATPCEDDDLLPPRTTPVTELHLARQGVRSIVWATGFRSAYDWIDAPVFAPSGEPVHDGGVTASPGLYFLGLRWLTKYKSFFIYGVGEDAERISRRVVR